jgi:RNA-binding protein
MLSSKQRAYLQGLAHEKKPVILLGHKGLSDAVIAETKGALLAHELIKCRLAEGDALDEDAEALASATGAELVARLGRMAILYKPHPEKKKQQIKLPKPPKKGLFDVHDDDG